MSIINYAISWIHKSTWGGAKNNFCQLHLTHNREGTEFMQNDR